MRFEGHLAADTVMAAFRTLRAEVSAAGGEAVGLLVDCSGMTGYERAAREAFVHENRELKRYISGVAVVTPNPVYRMVVGAMSLASTQRMRAFAEADEARAWLVSLAQKN